LILIISIYLCNKFPALTGTVATIIKRRCWFQVWILLISDRFPRLSHR